MPLIRGAGGGGKSGDGEGRTPVESADSLRSRQYARAVDALSEGEIFGLIDGLKSVYLDDTPAQNEDGTYNFSGVTLISRTGTQSQSYIPGFPAVEAETAVSTKITAAASVTRSISNANANALRITVSVPQLSLQNTENGDLGGSSVAIAIDVQTSGGGYVQVLADTISGKTTSRYQRAYRIELSGTGPWDVRLRRLTADSTSTTLQNATYWDSYTEIIDAKLTYPNTALIALAIDAERFKAIPRRGYEAKGLLVRIPSNYNPATRVYTGVWDGTFSIAWTDNPAWCFYDLLITERYGLGAFINAAQVDKWALYEIAKHCDELVDDGFGGQEPRFTCSLYLQTREEAYKVITTFASIFCGIAYWAGGSIMAAQDSPSDPISLFTEANTVRSENGIHFNYAGSSIKARHTVALVSWNDPEDRYRKKIEYVEDREGIARYGAIQTEIVAIGCTSRGQAHRYGRRILYTERMETETNTFRTGLDGLSVAPGEVIQTSDPVRAGVRMGGRIVSATASAITLDAAVAIEAGKTYTLWAVLPDGTVESRAVTTGTSNTDSLTVSPDFTTAPQAWSMWVLAASDLAPETWRVISIAEVDNSQAEITALKYTASKYAEIENDIILEALPTSRISATQASVSDVTVVESLYEAAIGVVGVKAQLSWNGSASRYRVSYRLENENWISIETVLTSIELLALTNGIYEFSIIGVNTSGILSRPTLLTKEIIGKVAPPADITGFSVIKASGLALASWLRHPDLDVKIGGRIVVRHSPATTGATWNESYIVEEFNGDAINGPLPLITGTYLAKALDSSGNWSVNAVSFVATEGMITGFTTVGTSTQAPTFSGTKTSTAVVSSALQLDGATPVDSNLTLIDTWSALDTLGGAALAGSYAFAAYMDLTTVATRRFEADITARSFDTGDVFDSRLALIDDWDAVDGTVINDCDVTLYAATTNDDPAGSPTWSDWTPFFVSDFTSRAMKFKLDLVSGQNTHNISISQLTVHAKIPA
jgi:predicted phage tail protein